jgi:Sir2 family
MVLTCLAAGELARRRGIAWHTHIGNIVLGHALLHKDAKTLTPMTNSQEENFEKAAVWLREADGLLITAGAGMGVDSGLPDFRGRDGFWSAYPALRNHGLSFEDMANSARFADVRKLSAWARANSIHRTDKRIREQHGCTVIPWFAAQCSKSSAAAC